MDKKEEHACRYWRSHIHSLILCHPRIIQNLSSDANTSIGLRTHTYVCFIAISLSRWRSWYSIKFGILHQLAFISEDLREYDTPPFVFTLRPTARLNLVHSFTPYCTRRMQNSQTPYESTRSCLVFSCELWIAVSCFLVVENHKG